VGGVDENVALITVTYIRFSLVLNVENVHLESNNTLSNVDVSQLVIIKTQVVAWRLHNHMSICWGFFDVNDDVLHVDLVNSQMLRCIICKFKQTFSDVLVQGSIMHKGLIKYNNMNRLIPMTTHVKITYPKFFGLRKQFNEVA
jgi:hypothetical protein